VILAQGWLFAKAMSRLDFVNMHAVSAQAPVSIERKLARVA
jgi:sensor c-di-GMP phosphodiesterase-like protein